MERIALIGYGEAGRTFVAGGLDVAGAFDADPAKRSGVANCADAASAVRGATLILSLVTADQARAAAEDYARLLEPGALWCDMNSVAPDTKRAAATAIEAAGARYVDVAVMAPVDPARLAVPLLVSGREAADAVERLRAAGFTNAHAAGDAVGRASAIKMIRSVMVKGVEALTAEMMLAADAASVTDEVLASLGDGWDAKAAYNLERMATHGLRRAAEMAESAKTLRALGVEPVMTDGTVVRQRGMAQKPLPFRRSGTVDPLGRPGAAGGGSTRSGVGVGKPPPAQYSSNDARPHPSLASSRESVPSPEGEGLFA